MYACSCLHRAVQHGPSSSSASSSPTVQIVQSKRILASEGDTTPVTNLVFMGMGEPLHNIEAVLSAIDIVSHPMGLHLSRNKVCPEWCTRDDVQGMMYKG